MKSLTMKVEGLRCDGCANRVRTRMVGHPGVQAADVSFEEARARVMYDPSATTEEALVDAVQELGYRVVERATP